MRKLLTLFAFIVPVAVIVSVLAPPVLLYQANADTPTHETVEKLRYAPSDALLLEIATTKHSLVPPLGRLLNDPVGEAESLLVEKTFRGRPEAPYPFNPKLLPDLSYAMLLVPRTLLKAYAASGDERFFEAAHAFLADWADYELDAVLPMGMLWNDHAIAVRMTTFVEFWYFFRSHSTYSEPEAQKFLSLVTASARRLADPRLYAFATNHGTMQNVALLQLELAFPGLAGTDGAGDLGIERQSEQSSYLISPDGVVLEHSAGYHRVGMELLAVALRFRTLDGEALPRELVDKYKASMAVYQQLRAADGTLPPLGDTSIERLGPEPLTTEIGPTAEAGPLRRDRNWGSSAPAHVYRDAGWALWWSGLESFDEATQTAITWSYFPLHGHKHADDMSFNVRRGNTRWWSSIGYWPLDHNQRAAARSWTGSNAPHRVDEPYASSRRTQLRGYAQHAGAFALDMERTGPDAFRVRRQIVHAEPGVWLTIDSFQDSPGGLARIVWGTGLGVRVTAGETGRDFELATGDSAVMRVHFFAATDTEPRVVRAQQQPFAGWVEAGYRPTPADALVLETPSDNTWLANLSVIHAAGSPAPADGRARQLWNGPQSWRFDLPGSISIERRDARISIYQNEDERNLELAAPPATSPWRTSSDSQFALAAARYGHATPDLIAYRKQTVVLLTSLLLLQSVLFLALGYRAPRLLRSLQAAAVPVWSGLAVWLHTVYFAA